MPNSYTRGIGRNSEKRKKKEESWHMREVQEDKEETG